MATKPNSSTPTFLRMTDEQFFAKIKENVKPKSRSLVTYHTTHLPELNNRLLLGLSLDLPQSQDSAQDDGFDTSQPDLSNTSKLEVVYLGNSMLERLKTTGKATRLANLDHSWNAGCGGDTSENILCRLGEGMYDILKQENPNKDIKVWVLVSGTNNLRPKKVFRDRDVASWRLLVEACLRMAVESKVLAVGMSYRKDVLDSVVDESNEMLKKVVEEINQEIVGSGGEERVRWIEATDGRITMDMLDDHVHLNEDGYRVFDEAIYPLVQEALESSRKTEQ